MLTSWLYALRHHSSVSPNVVQDLRAAIRSWPRGTLLKDDESGDILVVNTTWPSTDTVSSLSAGIYLHCVGWRSRRRPRLLAIGFRLPLIIMVDDDDVIAITERLRRGYEPDYSVPETEE